MTPDELKSLPKGDFIVMKTGAHPMRVHLKLFFKWGIQFDKDNPYTVPERRCSRMAVQMVATEAWEAKQT